MRDWAEWHDAYERSGSPLNRRLRVVQERLSAALAAVGPSAVILSLCSGDGRDVIGVLADRAGAAERAVLVELDPGLAERSRRAAEERGLREVEVRCLDAGATASLLDVAPVDVLMLCGVFGNIEHASVMSVVNMVPSFVKVGGYVIWTRGGSEPDRRPEIRVWFRSAGIEEIAFSGRPEPFGVGFNRVTDHARPPGPVPERLFTFK